MRGIHSTILLMVFVLSNSVQVLAQSDIPDHCFKGGEINCSKPECELMCAKSTTKNSLIVSDGDFQSARDNDTNSGNPGPYSDTKVLNISSQSEPIRLDDGKNKKNWKPLPSYKRCMSNNDEMIDIENKYEYFKNALINDEMIIEKSDSDKRQAYINRVDNADKVDSYEYMILKNSCYTYDYACIQGPDDSAKNLLNEYSETLLAIKLLRKDILYYYLNCVETGDSNQDSEYRSDKHKNDCWENPHDDERLEELQQMRKEQLKKIRALQCTP